MNPAERVDAIKSIAARMTSAAEFDRRETDLVFDEFGFGTAAWSGDRYAYVVDRAQDGPDQALQELLAYLEPEPADQESAQRSEEEVIEADTPWETTDFKVFISHCTSHVDEAKKLGSALSGRGLESFIAHESIQVSQRWENVILVGLRTCDAVIALLTPNFKESDWCEQELGVATAHGKLIVPLQFGVTAHGFAGKYQGLSLHGGDPYSEIARKVFEALLRENLTRSRMAEVVISRFIASGSYDTVRKRFGELKLIPNDLWTAEMGQRLRSACEENGEISDASIDWKPGPEMVQSLLDDKGV